MSGKSGGKRVLLGAFAGAHGVRGEVKIRTFTEMEAGVAAYGPLSSEDGRTFTVKVLRALKPGLALASVREIGNREDAAALSGVRLYVDRSALPPPAEGEFYIEDLVGLSAFDEGGALLGRVAAMHNFGAGDILELQPEQGSSAMVPFIEDAMLEIDLDEGRIVLRRAYLDAALSRES